MRSEGKRHLIDVSVLIIIIIIHVSQGEINLQRVGVDLYKTT